VNNVLVLLAIVGWGVAVIAARTSSRERKRRALLELKPSVGEQTPVLPVDAILDSLPLGVVVVDVNGREQFRNAAARDSSVARHEVVLIDAVIERLSRAAVAGEPATEQMELVGPPVRVLVVSALPSTSTGAVITVEDITERWRLDQVRTDFVANVSHELKTPVGAISVLAEILEGEIDDESSKNLVRRMVLESHRMASTIDDLLELSRIQLGGEMTFSPVDVTAVVAEAIERSQPLALKNHVALQHVTVDADCTISGDRFQILSAVGNLVDNAIKYSEDGGKVTISVKPGDDEVTIEVVDHGIGIPVASLDRIFERFYRVDRARSRDTGGTGLGLSIVRHVVTNHGGEVNVRSREGEGSTFSLSLPRNRAHPNGTIVANDERAVDNG
jgi:two-component system, OmpR family, sensor histidine kinase SenX3